MHPFPFGGTLLPVLQDFFFARHLEDEEIVERIVHKHWLLGFSALFWPTASFVASVAFLLIASVRGVQLGLALWAVVSLVWLLRNFFDYYLDAWIVTNKGIIDIAWHGWFHRESSRVLYSDIQGVSYEIEGVWGTLMRYGTVSVEKISTGSAISIDNVPYPRMVEALILQCMETYLHKKNMKDSKQVQELLSTLIAEQMVMRDLRKK